MNQNTLINKWSFLIILLVFQTSLFWNQLLNWIISALIILYGVIFISKNRLWYVSEYRWCTFFLLWALINGTLRGIFNALDYWDTKNMINGTMYMSMPLFAYMMYNKTSLTVFLRRWIKLCIPLFFIYQLWTINLSQTHLILGPVFLLGCFIFLMDKKYKFLFGAILLIMLTYDLSARSQVIKAAVTCLLALAYFFRKRMSDKILNISHWSCYLLTIVLLYNGITGKFNVFEDMTLNEGKYMAMKKGNDGSYFQEDLSADTRTFIYREVIESAIKNDYVWFGRTLARGNDTYFFASMADTTNKRAERYGNELCHLNVFTWLGLIGVILWSIIYFRASYLAVYYSRSIALKLLGCLVAFHWMYGWVEDVPAFDMFNISFWMIIGMCLSVQFREMTDSDFEMWFKGLFCFKRK